MGTAFCFFAFVVTFLLTRKSLGRGVCSVVTAGYFYGIVRARIPDGASHFMVDAAVAGAYLAVLLGRSEITPPGGKDQIKKWLIVLSIWPILTILFSPFVDAQDILIQFVGLRAAIYFLPFVLLGGRLSNEDLLTLGYWLSILNIIVFVVGVLEFQFGIETFIPKTDATELIFRSSDVGDDSDFRIPATFTSAHAYGSAMLFSSPFIVLYFERVNGWRRALPLVSLLASMLGIFMAAARSPVIQLAVMVLVALFSTRPTLRRMAAVVVIAVVVGYIVYITPRFQRFTTLSDTDFVRGRVAGSSLGLFDVIADYPLGVGLGGAIGTSIPYFLQDRARPAIGIENEFGRIALEQSVFGLILWAAFIVWILLRRAPKRPTSSTFSSRLFWINVAAAWGTASIGTGLLSAIPGTPFLFLQMGMIASLSNDRRSPRTQSPDGAARPEAA